MKNYKLIGLSGTTGAGKTEVAKLFSELGFEVVSADFLAREIMKNKVVLSCLSLNFGDDIVQDGGLNRSLLAKRAFADREKTDLLNRITHPFIIEKFVKELNVLEKQGVKRILFDAPQLFESGLDALCDFTVAVTADERERLQRIEARDLLSPEQAKARADVQFSDGFFRENCDFVIENNSDLESLRKQVGEIISKI